MGRNAKPLAVHRALGNPSKLPESVLEGDNANTRIKIEIPDRPKHLTRAGAAEWDRITPLLLAAGLLAKNYMAVAAAYCEAYGEWVTLSTEIKEGQRKQGTNVFVDVTPSGYRQISVIVQARDRARNDVLRFAKEFGLTPASHIQSTAGQQMALPGIPDDPMENFLSASSSLAAVH